MVVETIMVSGQLIGHGERPTYRGSEEAFVNAPDAVPYCYGFYNQSTGEVWGLRVVQSIVSLWLYTPGDQPLDLLLPYEQAQAEWPVGLLAYVCDQALAEWRKQNENLPG